MPERGGSTTQSGILYQNSVAALYLARLIDAAPCPETERVTAVRVEAPEHVDDTVVTFADNHRTFIQVKENVGVGDAAWSKLWRDFDEQYRRDDFHRGQDRLLLHVGRSYDVLYDLHEVCERAGTSPNYAEWRRRLTKEQHALVDRIKPLLHPELVSEANLLSFFKHIGVEIWPLTFIEDELLRNRVPASDQTQQTLFSLLRDRVGGAARIRGVFTAETLREDLRQKNAVQLRLPPGVDTLHASLSACGDLLRQHKGTFGSTGWYVERGIVNNIVAWAQTAVDEERVALLLDQAGMGKTVVMQDVLRRLEAHGTIVLAIKADLQLSGIVSHGDLQGKLHLPESVESAVARLAALNRVVVLIDQIDALSLSLARDQGALNVALELIARLRRIPGVVILVSCRTFDRKSDPRLRNVAVDKEFVLPDLADEDIREALLDVGVDSEALTMTTRTLLRVPLHLDLFVRAIETQPAASRDGYGIESLQDLYALLWQNVVLITDPYAPSLEDRVEVLRLMTERMQRDQQTAVSQALFATPERAHLQPAVTWLASTGILVLGVGEWSFLHQTFFDYCYARQFVESGGQLATTILSGDQGFSSRPYVIQVLAYLRGRNHAAYIRELNSLLWAADLRFHLRDLVLRWFGSLNSPTDKEWTIARRLLADPNMRPKLMRAFHSQLGWWPRIKGTMLPEMLSRADENLDTEVIPYLNSLIEVAQADIATILRRHLGQSNRWNIQIPWVLSHIRTWQTNEVLDLYEAVLREVPDAAKNLVFQLHNIATTSPQVAYRVLRLVLDRLVDAYLATRDAWRDQADDVPRQALSGPSLLGGLEDLNSSMFVEALASAAHAEPQLFLDLLLPWLTRVLTLTPECSDWPYFTTDDLASGWHDSPCVVQRAIIQALIGALVQLVQKLPDAFQQTAHQLSLLPYETPQKLLAVVYATVPQFCIHDALEFIVGDERRLMLGDHDQYESRRLITGISPFLSDGQRTELEVIHHVIHAIMVVAWRRRAALVATQQLYLLQAIPADRLTERGSRRLSELERKFPGVRASDKPTTMHFGIVGAPISYEAALKMSDKAWLHAMSHYHGAVQHKDFLKGGTRQLSGVLVDLIQGNPRLEGDKGQQLEITEDPERFYRLLQRVPDTVDDAYAQAFVTGFAESTAPSEWLYEVVRRFAIRPERDIKRTVAWALEKRASDGLPDDLLDLLERNAMATPAEDESGWMDNQPDPYNGYLNSARGSSFKTLMRALDQRATEDATERKWRLIAFAAVDPSTALRAGAIEQLLYLLYEDL